MLKPIFTLFLIFFFTLHSQAQKTISDTTFISRDTSDGVYHAIFIEKNKNSTYYDWLTNFQFDHNDSLSYAESTKDIYQKNPNPFAKNKIPSNLPREWCKLNQYKNKFYLYIPSDYGNNSHLLLSDTTVIQYFMDGPYALALDSFKTINTNTFELNIHGTYSTTETITIYIIDWKNQIAVFDNHNANEKYRYSLMVGVDHAKKYPIVVNYCRDEKQMEFKFDEIDFSKLLKSKSK